MAIGGFLDLLQRKSADSADVTVRKLCLFMPIVECILYQPQLALTAGVIANIKTTVLQAANDITGDDKGVFSHIAQDALSGHTA